MRVMQHAITNRSSVIPATFSAFLVALVFGTATIHAHAGGAPPACAQPLSTGAQPTASDCLFILKAAIGSETCLPACICAPKGTLPATATDALLCLQRAVGQPLELNCPCSQVTTSTTTDPTTTTTTTTSTTTLPAGPVVLKGVLAPTNGRFNYNLTLGIPGADLACNGNFPGTHACLFSELESAEAAGDLVGITDLQGGTVTSFWAIDPTHDDDTQCTVSVAWDYATAHTGQFAERANLDNASGTLAAVQSGVVCAGQSWVGCCQ